MSFDRKCTTDHIRDSVNPYIKVDLVDAKAVRLYHWIEAVTGTSTDTFETWTTAIWRKKWFEEDEVVRNALVDFCSAGHERARYDPFATLCNRILALARGTLPGIPKTSSYPVDDQVFINAYGKEIATAPHHGRQSPSMQPDILVVGREVAQRSTESKVDWWEILYPLELKFLRKLVAELDRARVARGMSPSDPDSGLVVQVRDVSTKSTFVLLFR